MPPSDKAKRDAENDTVKDTQETPGFIFGFPHTEEKDADCKDLNTTPAIATASISASLDFKFNFGYTPSQEPSRKLLKPHSHVAHTDEKPNESITVKPSSESTELSKDNEKPKENAFTFAFSLPEFEGQNNGTKSVFKFPSINQAKPDEGTQSTSGAENSSSLVTRSNHTTTSHIDKKDYQNEGSLFEGGDVELYHYVTDDKKWVTQNKGYLQIIKIEESSDECQLVFSRVGTSVVVINARIRRDAEFMPDRKRYLKVPLYNSVTKTASVALFRFSEEELRDSCLEAMRKQDIKEEKTTKLNDSESAAAEK